MLFLLCGVMCWYPSDVIVCLLSVYLCFNQQKVNPKTGAVTDTPVGMMDVYQEFNELSDKFKIMKFKSKVSASLRQAFSKR